MSLKTIKDVSSKTSTKGNQFYSVVFTDGSNANCFKEELFQILLSNVGQAVELDVASDKTGKYWNINGVKATTPEAKFEQSLEPQLDKDAEKQKAISRSVALNNSIQLYKENPLITIDVIIETADKFVECLNK